MSFWAPKTGVITDNLRGRVVAMKKLDGYISRLGKHPAISERLVITIVIFAVVTACRRSTIFIYS